VYSSNFAGIRRGSDWGGDVGAHHRTSLCRENERVFVGAFFRSRKGETRRRPDASWLACSSGEGMDGHTPVRANLVKKKGKNIQPLLYRRLAPLSSRERKEEEIPHPIARCIRKKKKEQLMAQRELPYYGPLQRKGGGRCITGEGETTTTTGSGRARSSSLPATKRKGFVPNFFGHASFGQVPPIPVPQRKERQDSFSNPGSSPLVAFPL